MLTPQNISLANAWNESFEDVNEYIKYLIKDIEKYKKQADCNAKILAIKERTFTVINDFVNNTVALIETQNTMLQQQQRQQQQQQYFEQPTATHTTRICDMPMSEDERHYELLNRLNQIEELIESKTNLCQNKV